MIPYNREPLSILDNPNKAIYNFHSGSDNIDEKTVQSFGEEWQKFSSFNQQEIQLAGDQYFDIVPKDYYEDKSVLDIGCGSGRWTKYLCRDAASVDAVDPSEAVFSASALLRDEVNVRISKASVDQLPFADNSFDFVFSLGVLHHIPNTQKAMKDAVSKLKVGGYFLVYLYYSLDNRGPLFKLFFHMSNLLRNVISRLPSGIKKFICDLLAFVLYLPFVFLTKFMIAVGLKHLIRYIPLSYYHDKSIKIIRNDSLDRFGTPLEQRFSKNEIMSMMKSCKLDYIVVSPHEPYWHAVGKKIK